MCLLSGCATHENFPCWAFEQDTDQKVARWANQPDWTDDTNEVMKSVEVIEQIKAQRARIGTLTTNYDNTNP